MGSVWATDTWVASMVLVTGIYECSSTEVTHIEFGQRILEILSDASAAAERIASFVRKRSMRSS